MRLTKGETFARFRILRSLGSGSSGEVYLVLHPTMERQYVLKILSEEVTADAEFRERFNRERRTVVKLVHPNVVRVHVRDMHRGLLYTVMDYIEGHDLAEELERSHADGLPLRRVLAVTRRVAAALDYAHHRGMMHRNVRPSNIFSCVSESGRRLTMLSDFGLAPTLFDVNGHVGPNTAFGMSKYVAPEQLRGEDVSRAADQYALAATAYHLLGDRIPDRGAVKGALFQALSEDPNERFDSCARFATALAKVESGQRRFTTAAPTRPVHRHEPPRRTLSHHLKSKPRLRPSRRAVISIVAALSAVTLVLAGIFVGSRLAGNHQHAVASMEPSQALVRSPAVGVTPPSPGCRDVQTRVESMTPREKLAQLLMVGVTGAADARAVVTNQHIGGIFVGSWTDLSMFTDGSLADIARSAEPLPLAVSVDEEGGRVDRLKSLIGPAPSARSLAASATTDQVYEQAKQRGLAMKKLGITVDFAPVVDVSDQPDDTVVGDRSFSNKPDVVTAYAGAYARGLRDAGLLPVLKHFPGHGHGSGDSHTGQVTTPPVDQLKNNDLVPYRTLLDQGAVAVMVGHLQVPGLTDDMPASLSPQAIGLLRSGDYGGRPFNGLVFTDDLSSMKAISERFGVAQSVLMALQADADIALWVTTNEVPGVLDRLEAAVNTGELTMDTVNQKVLRTASAKMANGQCGR